MTSQIPPDIAAVTAVQALAADWNEATAATTSALAQNEQLQQVNAALTEQLAATPKPTLIGGSPQTAQTLAGISAMDAKYGAPGKMVRLFCPTTSKYLAANRPVVGSWNTLSSSDAAVMAKWLRSFYKHEFDHLYEETAAASRPALVAQYIEDLNDLHEIDSTGSLGLDLTADALTNTSKFAMIEQILKGCPWLGHIAWDFDGASPKTATATYHPYTAELAALPKFLAAHPQITSWGVAELGWNRAQNDPTGVARAAALSKLLGELVVLGPEYISLWEANSQVGSTFDTPAEVASVASAIQVG